MADVKIHESCDACLGSKVKCSQAKPSCSRCNQHGQECVYSPYRKIGRPSYKALAARASKLEQQERQTASGKCRASKKQCVQQPLPLTPTQEKQKHGRQLPQPAAILDDASIDDSLFSSTVSVLSPNVQTTAGQEGRDIGNYPLVWSMPDSEFTADFGTSGYDIEEATNSADLGNIFDLWMAAVPMQTATQGGFAHDQTHTTSELNPNNSPRYPNSSSHSNQTAIPFRQPTYCSSTGEEDGYFQSRQVHSALDTYVPQHHKGHMTISTQTTAFSPSDLPVHPSSKPRCTWQCHVTLTTQLTYMTEYQANNSNLPLDFLLNLDKQINGERERVLGCPACLGNHRRGQTLMLVTMVVEKLLGFFEHDQIVDPPSNVDTSLLSDSATHGSSRTSTDSMSSFPHITPPLIVGDVQLDDSVKMAFCQRLLRTYLERQMRVVAQLDSILEGAKEKDVSCKVTSELLADVAKRAEYLLGIMVLTDDGRDPFSIRPVMI